MDQRENILSQLVIVCQGVTGIEAVNRNQLDVQQLKRPAVIVHDGAEQILDAPPTTTRQSKVQRMELAPTLTVIVRGNGGDTAGALLTLYRNRIVLAVLSDVTLAGYVGSNGGVRYEGAAVPAPDAEGREYRIELNLVFTYMFRLSDLAA